MMLLLRTPAPGSGCGTRAQDTGDGLALRRSGLGPAAEEPFDEGPDGDDAHHNKLPEFLQQAGLDRQGRRPARDQGGQPILCDLVPAAPFGVALA